LMSIIRMSNSFFVLINIIIVILYCCFDVVECQIELCQSNCESSDRLVGPTKMLDTRSHPWKVAQFPSTNGGFCKLGCQLFYVEVPKNTTCKRLCNYFYRYKITSGYSDIAEEAKLECQDGCEIALQVCEAGYYCNQGEMLPCPPGKYREAVTDVSILALDKAHVCTDCPYGRYRPASKGKSPDECTKCPRGVLPLEYSDVSYYCLIIPHTNKSLLLTYSFPILSLTILIR